MLVFTDHTCSASLQGSMDIPYGMIHLSWAAESLPWEFASFYLMETWKRKAYKVFMVIEIFAEVVSVNFFKDIIQWKSSCSTHEREYLWRIRPVHILVNWNQELFFTCYNIKKHQEGVESCVIALKYYIYEQEQKIHHRCLTGKSLSLQMYS